MVGKVDFVLHCDWLEQYQHVGVEPNADAVELGVSEIVSQGNVAGEQASIGEGRSVVNEGSVIHSVVMKCIAMGMFCVADCQWIIFILVIVTLCGCILILATLLNIQNANTNSTRT